VTATSLDDLRRCDGRILRDGGGSSREDFTFVSRENGGRGGNRKKGAPGETPFLRRPGQGGNAGIVSDYAAFGEDTTFGPLT
jgi:hypothetical protein